MSGFPGLSSSLSPSYLSLPSGWNTAWAASKVAAASSAGSIAGILNFGDSIAAGTNSSGVPDFIDFGYFGLLRNMLTAKGIPLAADFYPLCSQTVSGGSAPAAQAPWGTPSAGGTAYEVLTGRGSLIANAGTITFTLPYAVNAHGCDLLYLNFGAATPGFTITGTPTSPIAVTTTAANTAGNINIPGPMAAGTVITMTANNGNGLFIGGMSCRAASAGLGFVRNGFTGAKMVDFSSPAGNGVGGTFSNPPDKLGLWAGTAYGAPVAGFPFQPSLAIIEPVINDTNSGVSLQAFRWSYTQLIRALRAGIDNCSIICMMPQDPDNQYGDNQTATLFGQIYYRYKEAISAIAREYNCALFDVDSWFQQFGVTNGWMTLGNLHPTASSTGSTAVGHYQIAAALASIL